MSDTNDTLQGTASAETPVDQQAEGTDGSASVQQTASKETPEKLYAGKYHTVEELEAAHLAASKLIGKKTIDASEAAKVMGLTKTADTTPETLTRAEVKQVVQSAGPDVGAWFKEASTTMGQDWAIQKLSEWTAKNAVQEALANTLGPVNERLATEQVTRNEERKSSAVERVAIEHPDFIELAEDMKTFFTRNPRIVKMIEEANTIAEKQEWIEAAYFKVSAGKQKTSSAAAKAAGVVDAQTRDTMKSATVSGNGARGGKPAPASAEDDWFNAMQGFEKGRNLFKG